MIGTESACALRAIPARAGAGPRSSAVFRARAQPDAQGRQASLSAHAPLASSVRCIASSRQLGRGARHVARIQSKKHVAAPCASDDGCAPRGQIPSLNECFEEEGGVIEVHDDLDSLLAVVPPDVRETLVGHPLRSDLLEIIMDLGRAPEARFLGIEGGEPLRANEITAEELAAAEASVGSFGTDNRAGIEGTLHRISAMRNRRGKIVGLTCRVGRAVSGHVGMIRDMLEGSDSILFLGRPGIGKSTVIREIARVLADELHKRVVIIDTSNEIGGDGDVPHRAIGGARRMQVPDAKHQDKVMIEAVENHMPQVIIIDEISTVEEALACRTIAERGVQLVATAHGQLLENIIKNPTLADLVGGIQSVTLGDDEARARGTQKSILERKAPATFPTLIEMRQRSYWVAHNVEESVDALLSNRTPLVEVRVRNESHEVVKRQQPYDHGEMPAGATGAAAAGSGGFVAGGDALPPVTFNWAYKLGDVPDKDDALVASMVGGGASGGKGGVGGGKRGGGGGGGGSNGNGKGRKGESFLRAAHGRRW